ncbi:ParB/RepB/Spo0J family partition protein [Bacillaceae bacterium W0354]
MARRLGRGLDALLSVEDEESVQDISLKEIRPNPYQPRKIFEADAIDELKDSIIQYGVLQPIIVRKSIKGFEIVVGERRYRASKEAGLETIPAVVRDLTDEQMMELALLENLQREDLTPMEEAEAYERLINELKIKQEELAKRLGKSRPHITNMIRLLSLPETIRAMINSKELSMGHGRAILALKNKDEMILVANKIRKENLNVRQVEQLITQLNERQLKKKTKKDTKKDIFVSSKEEELRDYFGTSVNIQKGKRKGKIEIEFYNNDDLNRILDLLTSK